MKKILFIAFAVTLSTASFSQHSNRPQRPQREFNPEELAQRQTNRLHHALKLDSTQYQAVLLMNYADAVTIQDSMKARRERAEKMRANGEQPKRPSKEEMNARMEIEKKRYEARNEQMKMILTPEQYEKYIKLQDEHRKKRKENSNRGAGKRRPI